MISRYIDPEIVLLVVHGLILNELLIWIERSMHTNKEFSQLEWNLFRWDNSIQEVKIGHAQNRYYLGIEKFMILDLTKADKCLVYNTLFLVAHFLSCFLHILNYAKPLDRKHNTLPTYYFKRVGKDC